MAQQYGHETDITWLVPTCTLPRYVRETIVTCGRRRGPIKYHGGRVVGWSNLAKLAPSSGSHFERRVFWLAKWDPYDGGGAPCEAVDPFTVSPGVAGKMTKRAWGRDADFALAPRSCAPRSC